MTPKEIINIIKKRYNDLGYNIQNINLKIVEMFKHQNGDLNAMEMDKNNIDLYIDEAAYRDLKNNNEAMFIYFAHELAHAASDANHGDSKFEIAVKRYNASYSPKTVGGNFNTSEYNKKYLPRFFKKDSKLDNVKSNEEFINYLKSDEYKKLLKESIFNY